MIAPRQDETLGVKRLVLEDIQGEIFLRVGSEVSEVLFGLIE